ncbi:hypothetical protein Cyast_2597 [Cyanobacterium stanieri PCC 7202]|uniref:Uncharacterized protein n=1 Tax=Cyanobacterium stanieri (strain ATCC 29140 / PCC 7202) TaxID=292563 RepID=K9YQ63_CYASC|nr:hypothetical protein Cyast_2597 [Cyanobacterium stanieri PCC 7202]
MLTNNILPLKDAKPSDRIHLLLWDDYTELDLKELISYNNAQCISYRENLLSRINPQKKYLMLEQNLDEELTAIKEICSTAIKPVVILKEFDILLTYLYIKPSSPITLFWEKLASLRHLEKILWLILPTKLNPPNWNVKYLQQIN